MNRKNIFIPLNKKGDFKQVFEHGCRFSSKYFTIYAKPNMLPVSRIGLSVSKKLANAVIRNKIKRRLREALRKQLTDKPLKYDFVVVAKKDCAEAVFADLSKNINIFLSGLK